MNLDIRLAAENDYFETEKMTREAFWDLYRPGCVEHFLLRQLRKSQAFIPELDYVAYDGQILAGNIVYTNAVVVDGANRAEVLCMGPLAVLPAYQKRGIGSSLLRKTIEIACGMGHKGIVIFGDPGYYGKFGFRNAKEFNIQTSEGENFDAFMVLELVKNGLSGVSGRFFEDEAFKIDEDALEQYDKRFPYKKKHQREGQLFG